VSCTLLRCNSAAWSRVSPQHPASGEAFALAASRSCTSRERHSLMARCRQVFVGTMEVSARRDGTLWAHRRPLVSWWNMEVEELWWAIVFLQIIAGWVFLRAA